MEPIRFAAARRIVVKVGSAVLAREDGRLNSQRIRELAQDLAQVATGLPRAGAGAAPAGRCGGTRRDLLLVSSGAVASGLGKMGLPLAPRPLAEKQALAAIGQGLLMERYEQAFAAFGQTVAQVLLSQESFRPGSEGRYNALNTLRQLLAWGVIPVINENDSVATEEIRVGDNDTLAAEVAELLEADLLILLTDTDGVYTADPRADPGARRLARLACPADGRWPEDLLRVAGGSANGSYGTGGMATKLAAVARASAAGIPSVIGPGHRPGVVSAILAGEDVGTVCLPPGADQRGVVAWR